MKRGPAGGLLPAIHRIAEERILQAQRDGEFDHLPGKGRPLDLEDDSMVAPHLRASYRILKNAGILPREMQMRKEISSLKELLAQVDDDQEAKDLVGEINEKILESNITGGFSVRGGMDQLYAEKVLERIRSRKGRMVLERRQEKEKG